MGSDYFEVKSAGRVLRLFEILAANAAPMSLREITNRMGTPESSTYKLLQTLLHRDYVQYTDNGHDYRLGFRLYELLAKDASQHDLVQEFESVAGPVVDRLGEAMFLARLDRTQVIYIAEYHGSQPIRFVSHLGMRLPAHATALGKVLLAQLSPAELEKRLPDERLGILTSHTIATRDQLFRELATARSDQVAYSFGEAVEGVRCVASPVHKAGEVQPIAAVSMSGLEMRMNPERWQQMINAVLETAGHISIRLGRRSLAPAARR